MLVCIMIYVIEVKHKINDICTNVFNTHNGPLWETNIVYIISILCCNLLHFIFNKKKNYVTWEIQFTSDKCKYEELKSLKRTEILGNMFLNEQ